MERVMRAGFTGGCPAPDALVSLVSQHENDGRTMPSGLQGPATIGRADNMGVRKHDNIPRRLLLDRSPASPSRSATTSPSPAATTPTIWSFGLLSPRSSSSSIQSPPSIAGMSFCHSRDSSFGTSAPYTGEPSGLIHLLKDAPMEEGHRRSPSSVDLANRHGRQWAESGDLTRWRRMIPDAGGADLPPEPEPEEDNDDLRAYRQGGSLPPRNTAHDETCPEQLCDGLQHVNSSLQCLDITADEYLDARSEMMREESSEEEGDVVQQPSESTPEVHSGRESSNADLDSDSSFTIQAERVARSILDTEFDLDLGISEPPSDVVEAVRVCLDEISLTLQHAHGMGFLPFNSAALGSEASGSSPSTFPSDLASCRSAASKKKRALRDLGEGDGDLQEESDEEGDTVGEQSEAGQRKKAKCEQYPCPFRKRTPYKFNCRKWEYCAKAPFKNMTELKKHILKYHQDLEQRLAFKCIRCHVGFIRVEELHSHMRLEGEDLCRVQPPPSTADEISPTVETLLRSRAVHFDWASLWRALFPEDTYVPDPEFEPIVELHEVNHEYQAGLPDFEAQLSSTLVTLLPARDSQSHYVLYSSLQNVFKDFISTVFQKSQLHAATESAPQPPPPPPRQTPTQSQSQSQSQSRSQSPAPRPPPPRPTVPSNLLHQRLSTRSFTSSSSSTRRSTSTLSRASRPTSTVKSISSSRSRSSTTQPALHPLPSRPVPLAAPVHKWQRALREEDTAQRDSGIDVDGARCFCNMSGNSCICGLGEVHFQGLPGADGGTQGGVVFPDGWLVDGGFAGVQMSAADLIPAGDVSDSLLGLAMWSADGDVVGGMDFSAV
ncbi:hypothetical protein B0T25DRAFT_170515 [Lasiosphaeria hispida]|uniref:C2H2-type domain-containing protein n=1 Tax=Lasiosphaeria hispida TaxID=260671 RepID=A0AAJ0HNE9_9PEZI|nr:hypothetical protein B0T25DRAFT_170515 [Lasiosphaeria hispida]